MYVYFYESIFQDKSIHIVFTFAKLNNLKVIDDLYSQYLTKTLSSFFQNGGSIACVLTIQLITLG
jgi:hypothetical protein